MKKILYIIFATVSSVCLASCSTSLLDVPQKGVKSEANSYITDSDCEAAIAAAYSRIRTVYGGNFSLYAWKNGGDGSGRQQVTPYQVNGIWLKEMLGDDQHVGATESSSDYIDFESCDIRPTNPWIQEYYRLLYQCIYLSNLVIFNFKAEDSPVKSRDIAEAKFIRAFSNYELTTLWGPVPKVDRILATSEEQQIPASSEAEMWEFIEQDLTEALNCPDLTTKSSATDIDGGVRITTQAVRVLLARAYLWQKKYHEAKEILTPVITSGLYSLIEDYGSMYHMQANGCPEYIWEFVRKPDMNNPTYQYGWCSVDVNWLFYCGMSMGPDARKHYEFNDGYGWGFLWPTKSLYDAYVAEEGEQGFRLLNNIRTFEQVVAMNIYFDYDMELFSHEGLFRLKWLPTQTDEPAGVSKYYGVMCNTPVFRYADVLLMAAEACLNDNDASTAEQYLNMVRSRAKLTEKHGISMDDIKLERRLELAMEGLRFQDLKRWGDAPKVLADKGKKLAKFKISVDPNNSNATAESVYNAKYETSVKYYDNTRTGCGWQDSDYYLPYPEAEILVNKALKQH